MTGNTDLDFPNWTGIVDIPFTVIIYYLVRLDRVRRKIDLNLTVPFTKNITKQKFKNLKSHHVVDAYCCVYIILILVSPYLILTKKKQL